MEATTILMDEHRVIERVLHALDIAAHRLLSGEPIKVEFFLSAAEFIQGFADGCHHKKEEGVLFPAMEAHGVPREGGPTGVMLAEHEEGRRLTRTMRAAAERLLAGEASAKEALAANARGYVALLRPHIAKEDNVLFPMADRVIPASEHAGVAQEFERVEHEETGEGVHEKYLALAEALEQEAYA
jgi:hemerythrin-like domain-containing protein